MEVIPWNGRHGMGKLLRALRMAAKDAVLARLVTQMVQDLNDRLNDNP